MFEITQLLRKYSINSVFQMILRNFSEQLPLNALAGLSQPKSKFVADKTNYYLACKCDVLRNLVSFVQFKKHGKHPWRSVTFNQVASACNVAKSIIF